jgi:hypothetical protein
MRRAGVTVGRTEGLERLAVSAAPGIGMRLVRSGRIPGTTAAALTLNVPTLVRSGGRSVIGFATSGSVEAGAILIRAWPTPSTGTGGRMAGAGGSPRSSVNGHTGHGSVNGAAMRMMNSAAKNFLRAKDGYVTAFN